MGMFLMILFASFIVLVVAASCMALASGALSRNEAPELRPDLRAALSPSRFFDAAAAVAREQQRVPLELLLSQIERHVRLEQAAAETFLAVPTREALHTRTASPFVN